MLGLGIAVLGTMAAFHFSKSARELEAGVWPVAANVAAWIAALSLVAGALASQG